LLDGTIYLNPDLFKNLNQAQKTKILTKYGCGPKQLAAPLSTSVKLFPSSTKNAFTEV
jgi:hypothetical protein